MVNGGVIGKDNRPSVYSATGVWDVNEAYHARLSRNWPGEVLVDVGSFTKINTVTTQTVNLNGGKTWTPKCIIFFMTGSDLGSGSWQGNIHQAIGFTAGPSNSYGVAGTSQDNAGTSITDRRIAAKAITILDQNQAATSEADLSSFNAGGFTLNWTTNGVGRTNQVIGYMALGGDIQAEVLAWNTGAGTGNKSVSTGTFQPDLVFHASSWINTGDAPVSTTYSYTTLGAMNSTGEQWFVANVADDAAPGPLSNTSRWQRTDSCLGFTNAGEASQNRATYVSMDSTGFTVNMVAAPSSNFRVFSLCIKGVKSKLAAFNKTGAAAPVTQSITAPGWRPTGVLIAYDQDSTNASPNLHSAMSLGASDGTSHRAVGFIDRDGVTPTQADAIWRDDSVALGISLGPVVDSRSSLALTSTGFDLNWSVNNASATEILYAAIGTP